MRIIFRIADSYVELIRLVKINYDPVIFLENLRKRYPDLIIQGIKSEYIVNTKHAKNVITISLTAQKAGVLLSNKIETDLLMRFAFTRQINDAITKIGLAEGQDSTIIIIGKKSSIARLFKEIRDLIKKFVPLSDNSNFIKKKYMITKKQLNCIMSKNKLEDLLSEKSAVLFY